jgi:hypothetical protein
LRRFRIIGLLLTLAALAIAAVGCGGGEDPGEVLESASLKGLNSGNVDLSLNVKSGGSEGGDIAAHLSGPFQRRGKDLALVDLTATVKGVVNGEAIDIKGGLTLLSNRGFVNYEGTDYEIDPRNFSFAKSSFLPLAPYQGKESADLALSACQEAAAGLDLADLGDNLANDGSADVDGVSTTKVSGDLDVAAALDAIVELAENPSCGAQLGAAGRSADDLSKIRDELSGAVKEAHVEVFVGDDGIVRKIAGDLAAEPKGGGQDEVEADFDLTLSEVNEDPKITVPSRAKPILTWFAEIGVSPFEAAFLVSEPEGLGFVLERVSADLLPSGGA